jgi:hypothetical protein
MMTLRSDAALAMAINAAVAKGQRLVNVFAQIFDPGERIVCNQTKTFFGQGKLRLVQGNLRRRVL